jgi:hypothetical protein
MTNIPSSAIGRSIWQSLNEPRSDTAASCDNVKRGALTQEQIARPSMHAGDLHDGFKRLALEHEPFDPALDRSAKTRSSGEAFTFCQRARDFLVQPAVELSKNFVEEWNPSQHARCLAVQHCVLYLLADHIAAIVKRGRVLIQPVPNIVLVVRRKQACVRARHCVDKRLGEKAALSFGVLQERPSLHARG